LEFPTLIRQEQQIAQTIAIQVQHSDPASVCSGKRLQGAVTALMTEVDSRVGQHRSELEEFAHGSRGSE
jgi:hypothetical protein